MSLRAKIVEHLKSQWPNYVHKGELGKKAVLEWGYENENLGRRCRELENDGIIEKDPLSRQARYRYKKMLDRVLPPAYPKVEPERVGMF